MKAENNPAIISSNKILNEFLDLSIILIGQGFKMSKTRNNKKEIKSSRKNLF